MLEIKAIGKKREKSGKPAVVVKNVTKEFIIPHERKTTLFENLMGAFRPSTYEKFTALKDVSFTVERGESVGIIGDNGSGKSTLLKIISKILRPTSGSVEVNGRITPFLELGVGFSQDLTAKENIEVYSTIMGLTDREIARNIDNVLEFAGLTKFRDTKLKNFSSGMQVRLAFATAIQKKPEILLVDEVLAVGDMDFQQKCLDVFAEYKKKNVTMLFVSHDLNAVRKFCDKTLLLKDGRMLAFGKTVDITDRYVYGIDKAEAQPQKHLEPVVQADRKESDLREDGQKQEKQERWGNGKVAITGVKILDKYGRVSDKFNVNDPLSIHISYDAREPVDDPVFGIAIYDDNGLSIYGTNTEINGIALGSLEGKGTIVVNMASVPLISGKFYLTVAVHTRDHIPYDWHDKLYSFTMINTQMIGGVVDLRSEWRR